MSSRCNHCSKPLTGRYVTDVDSGERISGRSCYECAHASLKQDMDRDRAKILQAQLNRGKNAGLSGVGQAKEAATADEESSAVPTLRNPVAEKANMSVEGSEVLKGLEGLPLAQARELNTKNYKQDNQELIALLRQLTQERAELQKENSELRLQLRYLQAEMDKHVRVSSHHSQQSTERHSLQAKGSDSKVSQSQINISQKWDRPRFESKTKNKSSTTAQKLSLVPQNERYDQGVFASGVRRR